MSPPGFSLERVFFRQECAFKAKHIADFDI